MLNSPTQKRKKRPFRAILFPLISVVVLVAVAAGAAFFFLQKNYDEVEKVSFRKKETGSETTKPKVPDVKGDAVNFLLLGSDSRDSTNTDLEPEDMVGFRSDAIMLMQISADREHVTVMSIMRDNWVPIEGFGEAKINAAFSFGGVPLAVSTIEEFIGAPIDHGAIVDFQSFKGLTDALGGVTVQNSQGFQSSHSSGKYFDQGEILLNGDEALSFVRERYAFSDGDYQRVRNQQAYMKGLMGKLLSKETLTDPKKITETFEALKPYLIIDEDLGLTEIIGLGAGLRNIGISDITFFTSPTNGVGTSADGQSIVLPNWDEIANLRTFISQGKLHEYTPTSTY